MNCDKCGAILRSTDRFCYACGTRVLPPLKRLRAYEQKRLKEYRIQNNSLNIPFSRALEDFCWSTARDKHFISKSKYTLDDNHIPDSAFAEIDKTYESATTLFDAMAKALKLCWRYPPKEQE